MENFIGSIFSEVQINENRSSRKNFLNKDVAKAEVECQWAPNTIKFSKTLTDRSRKMD